MSLIFQSIDVIVFDDVYFSNRNVYWKMKQFVDKETLTNELIEKTSKL